MEEVNNERIDLTIKIQTSIEPERYIEADGNAVNILRKEHA